MSARARASAHTSPYPVSWMSPPTLSTEQPAIGRDAVGHDVPAKQRNQVGRDRDCADRPTGPMLEPAFVAGLSAVGPRGP